MTAAGGGSGAEFGDDYVAARLSIDVPEGSAQAIREITQEIDRFHTTLEATVHAEADAVRYLDQMAEGARKTSEQYASLNQQYQMFIQLSARGGGAPSMGVPTGGHTQPFSGMSAGMGEAGTGGYRPPNPADVSYQINSMPQGHAAEYLNMQQQRGNISAADLISISPQSISELANKISDRDRVVHEQLSRTDSGTDSKTPSGGQGPTDSYGGLQQRISRASSLAGQVMNEMGPGGSALGMGQMAVSGLNWARRRAMTAPGRGNNSDSDSQSSIPTDEGGVPQPHNLDGEEDAVDKGTMGMAGITKFLGPIAGVATAALSAFGIIQKGGGMIQGMRNVASVRGGAAGEGFEVEMKARMMSMNPFLTQDQSRQIYQAVMSEGYADAAGAGADNVIDFMKTNLTSMNISVADSAKMLRSTIVGNVKGDPQSVAGSVTMLRQELDNIRSLSRDSKISTPDYTRDVAGLQDQLIKAGASPQQAAKMAMTAEEVGSGDLNTKGEFARGTGDLVSSDRGQMALRLMGGANVPSGLMPGMTADYLSSTGQLDSASWQTMRTLAQRAAVNDRGDSVSHENAIYFFMKSLQRYMPDTEAATSVPKAKALYEQLMGNQELGKAEQRVGAQPDIPSSGEGGGFGGGSSSPAPPAQQYIPSPSRGGEGGGGTTAASKASEIVSPSGIPAFGGGRPAAMNQTQVSGAVQIGLTPEASRILAVMGGSQVSLSPTQVGANQGLSGHQVNAPAPGEG